MLRQQILLSHNNTFELYRSRVVAPQAQPIEGARVLHARPGTWQQIQCEVQRRLGPWTLGACHIGICMVRCGRPGLEGVCPVVIPLLYKLRDRGPELGTGAPF